MLDKNEKIASNYSPSVEESEKLGLLSKLFEEARSQREKSYRFFENRSFESFIQKNKDNFNSYTAPRNKSWKARVFKPLTHNRTIAVIAQTLSSIIKPQFIAQNMDQKVDREMTRVVDDLYGYSTDRERFEKKFVNGIVNGCIEGTIHILDEYRNDIRTVKDITSIDYETGEVKFNEGVRKDFEGLSAEVIPNLEMYPGNVYVFEIQDQPYIFRRRLVDYQTAACQYQKYKNWEYVQAGRTVYYDSELDTFIEKEEDDYDNNLVEILEYWCRQDDEYHVVIGGVLMTQVDNPIPYDHKMYPIAKTVYEPFDIQFYWGNSISNKLRYEQGILNTVYKMMIDKTYLSIFPPILTNDTSVLGEDVIVPGKMTPIKSGSEINPMQYYAQGVSQSQIAMVQMLENSMDGSSVNPTTAGQPVSGNATATEVLNMERNAKVILGLFGIFVSFLVEDFARLRVQNILSFYPEIEDMKRITVSNRELGDGTVGDRVFEFDNLEEMTPQMKMEKEFEMLASVDNGEELVVLDKDDFRNLDVFVKIVANPEPRVSDALQQLEARNKYVTYANNQLIDQMENTRQLVRAYGDDESKIIKEGVAPAPIEGQVLPSQQFGPPQPNVSELL